MVNWWTFALAEGSLHHSLICARARLQYQDSENSKDVATKCVKGNKHRTGAKTKRTPAVLAIGHWLDAWNISALSTDCPDVAVKSNFPFHLPCWCWISEGGRFIKWMDMLPHSFIPNWFLPQKVLGDRGSRVGESLCYGFCCALEYASILSSTKIF